MVEDLECPPWVCWGLYHPFVHNQCNLHRVSTHLKHAKSAFPTSYLAPGSFFRYWSAGCQVWLKGTTEMEKHLYSCSPFKLNWEGLQLQKMHTQEESNWLFWFWIFLCWHCSLMVMWRWFQVPVNGCIMPFTWQIYLYMSSLRWGLLAVAGCQDKGMVQPAKMKAGPGCWLRTRKDNHFTSHKPMSFP